MKKYILLFSLIAGGSVSCTNDFLKEEMVATITQDYFDTEKGFEQLIVGTYTALRTSKQYHQGPTTFLLGVDVFQSRVGNQSQYAASEWSPTGNIGNRANNLAGEDSRSLLGYYPIINNCNRAIVTIRGGKALGRFAEDEDYAAMRLSEALFNRAYSVYMLNTMYGDVYVPREPTTSLPANFAFPRESSESIYRMLISDLRYAYEHLPDVNELNLSTDFGRATKSAAAHFLAKLYLQRAQGAKYGTAEYGRNTDGTIDNSNGKSHLGMLYKGNVSTDLDSCIYFASQVIGHGYFQLEADYGKLFSHPLSDYTNEFSRELILSCVYGANGTDNGRYGNRMPENLGANGYVNKSWGIPEAVFEYSTNRAVVGFTNDFGFDLFVNKQADSRYQKSFRIEYGTASLEDKNTPSPNVPYYTYNSPDNATYRWTAPTASYFNDHILPGYNRSSWGGRQAVAGEHKMGRNDLALVYVENTKGTALDIEEALSQPFVVKARWIRDGSKYYYRPPIKDTPNETYGYNTELFQGLEQAGSGWAPGTIKYEEPNRNNNTHYNSYRDIPLFRLAETYLLRAEAYGRKGDYTAATADINTVRARAAYKPGETRAEVIARLQPGHESLSAGEQSWPYTVVQDQRTAMQVDASYWDGSSANSKAERYPVTATTPEERFVNFMLNELYRELNVEMIYYENLHHSGWQSDRILYHEQMASTLTGLWDTANNTVGNTGQNGNGKGSFKPFHTLKPFAQTYLDLLTDENGLPLDAEAKKRYQNHGY